MDDENPTTATGKPDVVTQMAITAFITSLGLRAELQALRKQLEDAEINFDVTAHNELTKSNMAGLLGDIHEKNPELASVMPTIQELIDRGLLSLDP